MHVTPITKELAIRLLPLRPANAHKGTFGRLLITAGSAQFPGAACMATLAALRSGAGIVTLASTRTVTTGCIGRLLEPTFLPLPETPDGQIAASAAPAVLETAAKCQAMLLGCGLGQCADTEALVEALLGGAPVPVVLDADGINLAARCIDMITRCPQPMVLTPHMMEMSRLGGIPLSQVLAEPVGTAAAFAARHGVTVVLKSAETVIARRDGGVYRLENAQNPGLAKGGSGDLLAGIIGALCAQGLSPDDAAVLGVWVHSRAGRLAADEIPAISMQPGDLLAALPRAWRELYEGIGV